jgi:hypothetical protein
MMSPGDAQKMTSYLFGLGTPQAVQAAAAKNQHNISFVALASSVAAAMKNVMTPQAAPPQGTVMQQAVQQMAPPEAPQQMAPPQQMPQQLPENSGIGQLNPGQGVQSMAGGGITGEPHVRHYANAGLINAVANATPRPSSLLPSSAALGEGMIGMGAVPLGVLAGGAALSKAAARQLQNNPGAAAMFAEANDPGSDTSIAAAIQDESNKRQAMLATPGAEVRPVTNTPATYRTMQQMEADIASANKAVPAGAAPTPAPASAPAPAPAPAPAGPARGDGGPAGAVTDAAGMKALYNQIEKLVGGKTYAQNREDIELAQPWKGVEHLKTVGEHSQDLLTSAKAMGIDVENKPAFARLSKLQTQADELLERKQNLAIIQGGLAMIRPGHWATAIAQGAGEGIGKYSAALDAHQASMGKLEDSRALLDTAKNTMNMAIFDKAVAKHENGLKDYLADARSKGDRAATMTDAQARTVATLAAQVSQNQTTIKAAGIAAQAHKDLWADRNKAGLDRATLMASAKNHPNYAAMFKSVAATMPGRTPDDIGLATTEQMMRAGMVGGGGIIAGAPPQQ